MEKIVSFLKLIKTLFVGTRQGGGSNGYPQCMFWIKNKKNIYFSAFPLLGFNGLHVLMEMIPDERT